MAELIVSDEGLKGMRETLCEAQNLLGLYYFNQGRTDVAMFEAGRIQHLISEIDRHRPLDKTGRHGNLHTKTCGCKDKWQDCPTCSGPTRRTVDMVCQQCGTDYAPE